MKSKLLQQKYRSKDARYKAMYPNWQNLPADKRWITGSILADATGKELFIAMDKGQLVVVDIDPNTICMSSPLFDKNGTQIWENDIIRINRKGMPFPLSISVHYGSFYESGSKQYIGFYLEWMDQEMAGYGYREDLLWWLEHYEIVVVGNLFEGNK